MSRHGEGLAAVEARGQFEADVLPAKRERKPKRIKVRPGGSSRVLTYHIYGKRPKRGARVRIRAGMYDGDLGIVKWRFSLYRGATYRVEPARIKEWAP